MHLLIRGLPRKSGDGELRERTSERETERDGQTEREGWREENSGRLLVPFPAFLPLHGGQSLPSDGLESLST